MNRNLLTCDECGNEVVVGWPYILSHKISPKSLDLCSLACLKVYVDREVAEYDRRKARYVAREAAMAAEAAAEAMI